MSRIDLTDKRTLKRLIRSGAVKVPVVDVDVTSTDLYKMDPENIVALSDTTCLFCSREIKRYYVTAKQAFECSWSVPICQFGCEGNAPSKATTGKV